MSISSDTNSIQGRTQACVVGRTKKAELSDSFQGTHTLIRAGGGFFFLSSLC